jgi:hypothetical protein
MPYAPKVEATGNNNNNNNNNNNETESLNAVAFNGSIVQAQNDRGVRRIGEIKNCRGKLKCSEKAVFECRVPTT